MTQKELKDQINQYLEYHMFMNLGTVSPEGSPMVATVAYVSRDSTAYLLTYMSSRKAQNILHNPHVAYTVDEDDGDVFKQKGLQVEGKASIITEEKELHEVEEMMLDKFPFITEFPQFEDPVMIKIEPEIVYYLDYSVEFMHRDKVAY